MLFVLSLSALADQSSGKKGALGKTTFVFVCLLLFLLFVCLFVRLFLSALVMYKKKLNK